MDEPESSTSLRTPPGDTGSAAPTLPMEGLPRPGLASPPAALRPGVWVGPYRVESLLAEGGMGAVYRARSVIPVREVALKVIRPGLVSSRLLKRFELEAEVLRRLDHPGIARIFSAGSFDAGGGEQPYFAMELVPGKPLHQYARERDLTVQERLALMAKIADAVQHAHTKGVIHRDLKPGNVLVVDVPDSGGGTAAGTDGPRGGPWCTLACQPKVLDFGVARLTDGGESDSTARTVAGQCVGTVPYMSPEQVAGDPRDVDTRSDVYALGVTLYELLAGRLPYDVSNAGLVEAARIIRERPPEPVEGLPRALARPVRAVLAAALHKDRAGRYQSAAEFADDLRRVLAGEPVHALPASAWTLVRAFARRHRSLALAAATACAMLVLGLLVSTFLLGEARGERDRTREALRRVAEGGLPQTIETLLSTAQAQAREGQTEDARRTLAVCEDLLKRSGVDDPGLLRRVRMLRESLTER